MSRQFYEKKDTGGTAWHSTDVRLHLEVDCLLNKEYFPASFREQIDIFLKL